MKRLALFLTIAGFLLFALLSPVWAGGDVSKGKATYERLCAPCHGISGKGNGLAAAQLPVRPRDHTDKNAMGHLTDRHLFEVIKNGGAAVQKSPMMPPFGMTLKDQEVRDVVAYVRTLARGK